MVEVRIYAEGGGEGQFLDTLFRNAWNDFFRSAGLAGRLPRVVRGKGRKRTYDLFTRAVADRTPDLLPLLLVDSEDAVLPHDSAWQHLKRRDGWDQPPGAGDDDAFLMVHVMETWFLADRAALRSYFGQRLNENAIPHWPALEAVPKADVLAALDRATIDCKKKYAKGRVSYDLLSRVDPAQVEQRCPHAQQLLKRLWNI